MAFSPQELDVLFTGAMQNYIFKFAFESRNPGCEFDTQAWVEDLNEIVSDNDLTIMNSSIREKLSNVLEDLDNYAIKKTQTKGIRKMDVVV